MDIFDIHNEVLNRYGEYIRSFLSIADEEIRDFIGRGIFEDRGLWPAALLQLNLGVRESGNRGITCTRLACGCPISHSSRCPT